jgi:phage N-6-adenine-methyltransferase
VTFAAMMTSTTDDWGTPREFFDGLDHEFSFELDVAASASNTKCDRYYSIEDDGLSQPWAPAICWMNPPYGRTIGRWVAKAWHESTLGATVVGLLPARTDTAWWHDYVERRAEVRFVRGRLRFYGIPKDAPFPSAIAIWRPA